MKLLSTKFFVTVLALVLLVSTSVLVGCEEGEEEVKDEITVQEEIEFGIVEWPGVTQKTHVLKNILERIDYDVEITTYAIPLILEGLSEGELDAFTGTWFQTIGDPLQEHIDEGSIVEVSREIEESIYKSAVPTYVYEAGVTSMADLHEHGEKFNHEYYGIEPGNEGNQIIEEAIEESIYNLEGWEMIPSSTSAMLTEVDQAIENEEWIVFHGWEPHWMNVVFDFEYLEDPEGIWGGPEEIGTIARSGLQEDDPNFYLFLEQFDIDSDIQSEWIFQYSREERDPEVVAEEWVEENEDMILEWLEGIHTTDGRDAQEVFSESLEQ